jgi:hypothetical protein
MMRMLRAALRALSIAVLALALTGCMKLDMELNLSADDTANGTMTFALDKQLLQLTGGSFEDLTGGETPLPSGVNVSSSDYEDDEFVGRTYAFEDVPIEQMNDSTDKDSMRIRREGDAFVISGALDLTTDALEGGAGGQLGQAALETAQVRIAISFPGPVQSATGEVDGNTVTWTPKVGERTELSAVGRAIGSGEGNALPWIAVALLVAVAIVVGAMLLSRRNRRPPDTPILGPPPASVPGGVPSAPAPDQPVMPSPAPDQPVDTPAPEQPVEPHRPVAPPPGPSGPPMAPPDEPGTEPDGR